MRRIVLFTLLLGVFLMSGPAWADFYVIAGGGAVGTKITSVPYTISTPGFYYLGGNLTYSGSGNAITVDTDDVTIDLMGFRLFNGGAPGSTKGIYMSGRTNVEIRNGTVRGFYFGVFEQSSSGQQHRVINVRAIGNNTYGVNLYGSNHLVKGCNGSNNGSVGIYLQGSGIITDSVASNNDVGIRVWGPGSILGNLAIGNSTRNFHLGNGVITAILVDRNSAYGLITNYYRPDGTLGVQWGTNAGTP